jgi:hypothetical protein
MNIFVVKDVTEKKREQTTSNEYFCFCYFIARN